jgi:ribosomal protein S18 acetylase RimI-like enzyme
MISDIALRYQLEESIWDTNYFGVRSGKLLLHRPIGEQDMRRISFWAQDFDFVTILNRGNCASNNVLLHRSDLCPLFTDMNVTFTRAVGMPALRLPATEFDFNVSASVPPDEAIREIAATCFAYSRFYNDPNLPADKARQVYVHWVNSAFNREDRFFVTATHNGLTQGFVLFRHDSKGSVIELIGVNQALKKAGIGAQLVHQMAKYVESLGVEQVQVGTQLSNRGAMKFYQRLGFTCEGCTAVFHAWPQILPRKDTQKSEPAISATFRDGMGC